MKLSKLRSGRTKLVLSPSKSLTTTPANAITPQTRKSLRSASKSSSRPSKTAKRRLTEALNSSIESEDKLITKTKKSVQPRSSVSDNEADKAHELSNLSSPIVKAKAKRTKLTSTNRKRKMKSISPSINVSYKSPTLKSKLRTHKLSISKASNDDCLVTDQKMSPKQNKSPSPLKKLKNVHENVSPRSKKQNLSKRDSPKKNYALKEPVVRLERLSKIVEAKVLSAKSPKVKIVINDELFTDCLNVSQNIFDSIHSEDRKSGHKKSLALVASTPKVPEVLDATLTIESEQEVKDNNTYELLEPKTPTVQKAMREKNDAKNETLQRDIKDKTERRSMIKKKCSVQFTSPLLKYAKKNRTVQNKADEGLVKISPKTRKDVLKSFISTSRGLNRTNDKSPAANSFLNSSRLSKANSFVKASSTPFASRIKTPDAKSATKKVPNFSRIHKKLFDKSESIIDAKKRLQNRHTALTGLENGDSSVTKTVASTVPKTSESSNRTHKSGIPRFAFKLRKPEATACILQNKAPKLRKSTEQNRMILKGVRTNRRFELQMKMRNINV